MFNQKLCVVFLCLFLHNLGVSLGEISYIHRCHWNDADCILKSAKDALVPLLHSFPERGIKSMDPLVLEDVKGDSDILKLNFKNMKIDGLVKCQFIKASRPEKLKVAIEVECPITVTGQYNMKGKFLTTDIFGNGDFKINMDKMKIDASVVMKQIEKDGKKYYKFVSFDYKYEPVDAVDMHFENLFGGDKEKAEPVNAILKESGKEIMKDIGAPMMKETVTKVVGAVGDFITSVPCEDIELE